MHFGFALTVNGNLITEMFMNKKIFNTAFTMGATHVNRLYLQRIAFTMAEILLSLTIIGVVAAITLPSLTGNINERTWNTQKKALYARMSQAIALMGSLNGYGISATESETASNAAKVFVTNGLAKVYKINNICDADHLGDCGIPSKITTSSATSKIDTPNNLVALNMKFNASQIFNSSDLLSYSQLNTNATAFETANGESVIVYYNPFCSNSLASPVNSTYKNLLQPTMCANFVYDLNGKKGPNTVGKDIGFMTAFYPTDTLLVAPNPIKIETARNDDRYAPEKFCRKKFGEDARAANFEELKSLFVNLFLVHPAGYNSGVMSKTRESDNVYRMIFFHSGTVTRQVVDALSYNYFYCIK